MTDGRMLIYDAGVRWTFHPEQPRQHGKWSGPSLLPAQLQAVARLAYEKAHPEVPSKPWVSPPSPQGAKGGKPGGYTAVGITNTELGDKVEDALQRHLGMKNEHPGRRQGPLDLRFDGHGYEVKAVSSMADEYKAKPKAREIASKKAYAAEHGLAPHTMIVVYHPEEKQLYAYSKPGIGAYRLTNEGNGWKFHGTIPLDLGDTSPEPELPNPLAAIKATPKQTLLGHIQAEHKAQPPNGSTFAELGHWHGEQHQRYQPNHFHEGANLGAGDRPPGWKTGEGSVPKGLHPLSEIRLDPMAKSILDTAVREHLKLHPRDTAANVQRRLEKLGYKVRGEPGGYTYNHILESTKRLKAEAASAGKMFDTVSQAAKKVPYVPPPTPAPGANWEGVDMGPIEQGAYQNAKDKGLSEWTASGEVDWHNSHKGDPWHAAQAKGLQRYIDEGIAEGQKWRQARADALTPPTEGWKHLTRDQVRAVYLGVHKSALDKYATERAEQLAGRTNISLFKDGSKLTYKMPLADAEPPPTPIKGAGIMRTHVVTPAQQRVLEQEVEKARRLYPNNPALSVTVGESADAGKFKPNVWGETYSGTGKMYLAPDIFGRYADETTENATKAGHWMPAYKGQGAIRSVFSHELGHTMDGSYGNGAGKGGKYGQTQQEVKAGRMKRGPAGMSAYGRKNTAETFAEAFAEWHLSNGKTTNPIAQRLAKLEDWGVDPQGSRGLAAIARARAIFSRELAALST